MRIRPFLLLAACTSIVPVACSLAVQSELDGKPAAAGGASADAGPSDALGGTGGNAQDAPSEETSDAGSEPTPEASDDAQGQDAPEDALEDASDADSDTCSSCTADQCCGGVCVETQSDKANCGACGHACGAGRTCASGLCSSGWITMTPASSDNERARACAVLAGDRVFIWGGMKLPGNELRGDGITYDPIHDQWTNVPADTTAPSPRAEPVCLWTGSKVFVWGGVDPIAKTVFADGALWDPTTGAWEALASGGPSGRARPVALWTGTAAIIWGGTDPSTNHGVKTGGVWTAASSAWQAISTTNAPPKNKELAGVWTGSDALIFGGRDDGGGNVYNTLYQYAAPSTNAWTLLAPTGTAPTARSSAFVGCTSARMAVWGGFDNSVASLGNGARVKLAAPTAWESLSSTNAPTKRAAVPFESGWAAMQGAKMHVLGGIVSTATPTAATDGATYDIGTDTWSAIPSWGSSSHLYGVGVWTGSEFVVWGGYDGSTPSLDGSRWMP